MSGFDRTIDLLEGVEIGPVFGVSWIPEESPRAGKPSSELSTHARMQDIVRSLDVDLAFVSSALPCAESFARDITRDGGAAVWTVSGPVGSLAARMGWKQALRATMGPTQELLGIMRAMAEETRREIQRGVLAGAPVVLIADDLAAGSGWIVVPEFAREIVMPLLGELAEFARGLGATAVFHSDGDVHELYPHLALEGFSAVHIAASTLSDTARLIDAARASDLVPIGGIPASLLLREDRHVMAEQVRAFVDGGALVVCDDGGLTTQGELDALGGLYKVLRSTA